MVWLNYILKTQMLNYRRQSVPTDLLRLYLVHIDGSNTIFNDSHFEVLNWAGDGQSLEFGL